MSIIHTSIIGNVKKMNWLRIMFTDSGGFSSSKRGLGALCLIYAMIIGAIVFFVNKDVSGNILGLLLALITAGTTLLGITVLEKK